MIIKRLLKHAPRNHDIKYFQCLRINHIASQCSNKRIIILHDHKEIESKIETNDEKIPPLKDVSDDDIEFLVKSKSLVVRRALNVQIKNNDLEQ